MSKSWGIKSKFIPDPETGFDKVIYVPNFGELIDYLNQSLKALQNISSLDIKDKDFFDQNTKELNYVRNQIRTYLRKNYPEEYQLYKIRLNEIKPKIKEIIINKMTETSLTGGSATFTPGTGGQYTTKFAFNPKKTAKGAKHNYYYKMGFKPVPKKIKGSGMEIRQLFESQEIDNYKLPEHIKDTIKSAYLKNNIENIKQNDFMYYITIGTGGLSIDEDMLRKLIKDKTFMGVYPKDNTTVQLGFRKK